MNLIRIVPPLCMLICLLAQQSAGVNTAVGTFRADEHGRLHVTAPNGAPMGIHTDLHLFQPGWKLVTLQNADDVQHRREKGRDEWHGRITIGRDDQACLYTKTLTVHDTSVEIVVQIEAKSDIPLEGVFFSVQMPVDLFAGGWATLREDNGWPVGIPLPMQQPYPTHILGASDTVNHVSIQGPRDDPELTMRFGRAYKVQLQDDRKWNSPNYGALLELHEGSLAAGQTVSLTATLTLHGHVDRSPVTLTLDAEEPQGVFDGMGGNYVFEIDAPQTAYTLDNLRVAHARVQMSLELWEPRNDNDDPHHIGWGPLIGNDRPGTRLRREFELARRLTERGIPLCVSVWYVPAWMYENPELDRNTVGRRIPRNNWPELIESIGSYLIYMRRRYQVEPALVSLNEPDLGVYVKLTADEYCEFVVLLDQFFQKHDIQTKILLGDVSNPRHAFDYVSAVARDEAARPVFGAVGFHTWGDAGPEEYEAWRELADQLDLPLLVAELGLDAKGWETRSYETWSYALRELKLFQNMLRHARPRSALYWQLTSDYALVTFDDAAGMGAPAIPTKRFWFVKHFSDITPPAARFLKTQSSSPNVQFTAFSTAETAPRHLVLHVSNPGAARTAAISGLPDNVRYLHPVVTDMENSYFPSPPIEVENGTVQLELTAHSLTTLSTQSADERAAVRNRP